MTENKLEGLEFVNLMKEKFESSSELTEEFANFSKIFAKGFRKYLQREFKATDIDFSRGHFYMSGFFTVDGQTWYFNSGDLRWNKSFMIRTAKNNKDYTGGSNIYVGIDTLEIFDQDLRRYILK